MREKSISDNPRLLRILGFLFASAIAISPRSAPALLVVMGLGLLVCHWDKRQNWFSPPRSGALTLLVGAFLLWSLASSLWAPRPQHTAGKALLLVGAVLVTHVIVSTLDQTRRRDLGAFFAGASAALAIAGLLLSFEFLTGQLVQRTIYMWFPSVAEPFTRHFIWKNGVIVETGETIVNRRVFAWCLLLVPALMWLSRTGRAQADTLVLSMLALGIGLILIYSTHQSSQFLLIGAVFFFYAVRVGKEWGLRLLAASLLGTIVLIVPIALIAGKAELNHSKWLFDSARARVNIWANTGTRVVMGPWHGIGADSSQILREELNEANRKRGISQDPFSSKNELGRHAHNVYLQVWYELGLPGALLFAAVGILLICSLASMERMLQPFGAAMIGGIMLGMATSYSMWQPWIMAMMAWAYIGFRAAARARADA